MPIEIKELIIQALIGNKGNNNVSNEQEEKKKEEQLDIAKMVINIIKNEKER